MLYFQTALLLLLGMSAALCYNAGMSAVIPLPLIRKNCFCLFTGPLYYAAAAALYLALAVHFFVAGHFFVYGAGTSDLRQLFAFFPYPCIVLVPAVGLFVRRAGDERGFDAQLPYSELQKAFASWLCAVAGFAAALLPLCVVPLAVDLFGDADAGQFCAGMAGSLLFAAAACAASVFLYTLADVQDALAFVLDVLLLAAFTLMPRGFLWRFSSFSAGIFSSRDVAFYIIAVLFFLFLTEAVLLAKKGAVFGRSQRAAFALEIAVLVLASAAFSRLNVSFDVSRHKAFSVSAYSRGLLAQEHSPVRIQYFVSPQLRSVYPQVADVRDYLALYADALPGVSFSARNADKEDAREYLAGLGVQRQQVQRVSGSRTEYADVYSAVVIECLDSVQVIPFVREVQGLEYDLASRIGLLLGKERKVAVRAGNGLLLESDYFLVEPWLVMQGFQTVPFESGSDALLLLLGSSALTQEESDAVLAHIDGGGGAVLALSSHEIDLGASWEVIPQVAEDTLLPRLADYGISFRTELAADLANVAAALESEGGSALEAPERRLVNYPLWLSVLPQAEAPRGMTLFWPSPLELSGSAEPFLLSSPYAWLHSPDTTNNPFFIEQSGGTAGTLTLAARVRSAGTDFVVLGDQYCVHTLTTQYLNAGGQGDFRNFLFLADTLLELNGEHELRLLKLRGAYSSALYKLADFGEFAASARLMLPLLLAGVPVLWLCVWLLALGLRRRFNRHLRAEEGA